MRGGAEQLLGRLYAFRDVTQEREVARLREDRRRQLEEELARAAGGRPHWGKLHTLGAAELRPLYPRFDDALAVRDRLDPDRTFANAYTERVLGP